jgi:hypothetical protein
MASPVDYRRLAHHARGLYFVEPNRWGGGVRRPSKPCAPRALERAPFPRPRVAAPHPHAPPPASLPNPPLPGTRSCGRPFWRPAAAAARPRPRRCRWPWGACSRCRTHWVSRRAGPGGGWARPGFGLGVSLGIDGAAAREAAAGAARPSFAGLWTRVVAAAPAPPSAPAPARRPADPALSGGPRSIPPASVQIAPRSTLPILPKSPPLPPQAAQLCLTLTSSACPPLPLRTTSPWPTHTTQSRLGGCPCSGHTTGGLGAQGFWA